MDTLSEVGSHSSRVQSIQADEMRGMSKSHPLETASPRSLNHSSGPLDSTSPVKHSHSISSEYGGKSDSPRLLTPDAFITSPTVMR